MHARAHAAKLTLCVQGVMDTGPEPELEALATIARRVFKADLACINFVSKRPCPAASHAAAAFNRSLTTCDTAPQVDADRQWTKASSSSGHLGLPPEIDRAISFDAHTILSDEVPPCTEALPRPAPPSVTPPLRPSAPPPLRPSSMRGVAASHARRNPQPLVVLDARKDTRFMYSQLVGRQNVHFYAGAPLCIKSNRARPRPSPRTTGGGTRRVRLVREEGRGVSG